MEDIEGVFITHEHSDHIKGLKVLLKKHSFFLFLHESIYDYLKDDLETIDSDRIILIEPDKPIEYEGVVIKPFEVSHDARMTLGFTFYSINRVLSIATDIGYVSEKLVETLKEAEFLVLESNHDEALVEVGPYPYVLKQRILGERGHLSNKNAALLIARLFKEAGNLKVVLLAHLSEHNNYPELALMSVTGLLRKEGIEVDEDLIVHVATRNQVTELYRIS